MVEPEPSGLIVATPVNAIFPLARFVIALEATVTDAVELLFAELTSGVEELTVAEVVRIVPATTELPAEARMVAPANELAAIEEKVMVALFPEPVQLPLGALQELKVRPLGSV